MYRNCFIFIYVLLIFMKSGISFPINEKSESSITNDEAQHKNSEIFASTSEKGDTRSQSASGFRQDNENTHVAAQDSGSYNKVNSDKNAQQNSGQFFGENSHRENADSAFNVGRQGGHRKGHHKSGRQSSYHKEESENNSSYYDDSDDQGGHFIYDSRDGGFLSAGTDRNRGSYSDDHLYSNADSRRGAYDKTGNVDHNQADKSAYDQQQHYNNHRNQARNNAHNLQGQLGHHNVQSTYYDRPQYTQYEPRRTITVYEDPREVYYPNRYKYQPKYDSDLVHLNFKLNPNLYYPSTYNEYYYY